MITEIRNGFAVKRYHTQQRVQEETNGHHSINVAAIILRINPSASRNLLLAAIFHDVAEVYTGDVPYPFKHENPNERKALNEAEDRYFHENGIPNPELTNLDKLLLKFADMMDLILSSLEEMGRGNLYARECVVNGVRHIDHMDVPDHWVDCADLMVEEVKAQCRQTRGR